jgi:hypothetical protein
MQYYDERSCSLGDYSLILSKLPNMDGIQSSISRFFNGGLNKAYHIQEMILIPRL